MRASTRDVYEKAIAIQTGYFNNKKHWASIQQGKSAFFNRWTQYLYQAHALDKIAETKAAHDRVDDLLRSLMIDAQEIRDKYFDR